MLMEGRFVARPGFSLERSDCLRQAGIVRSLITISFAYPSSAVPHIACNRAVICGISSTVKLTSSHWMFSSS
uniref:Uncharacterized protein n=1 Tax=Plectus sambesii TaxID=2011161 RepID=A0A914WCZ2_9BILA